MATCSTIKQRIVIHGHAYMYTYTEQQKPEKQTTFKPIYVKNPFLIVLYLKADCTDSY